MLVKEFLNALDSDQMVMFSVCSDEEFKYPERTHHMTAAAAIGRFGCMTVIPNKTIIESLPLGYKTGARLDIGCYMPNITS